MNGDVGRITESRTRQRLLQRLGNLIKSGRLTETEAEGLRSAFDPRDLDNLAMAIRVRHASATIEAAVSDGRMTQVEADKFLERLKNGEHSSSLRAELQRIRSRIVTPPPAT